MNLKKLRLNVEAMSSMCEVRDLKLLTSSIKENDIIVRSLPIRGLVLHAADIHVM